MNSTLNVNDNCLIGKDLFVDENITIKGESEFLSDVSINGNLIVENNVKINDSLDVSGTLISNNETIMKMKCEIGNSTDNLSDTTLNIYASSTETDRDVRGGPGPLSHDGRLP